VDQRTGRGPQQNSYVTWQADCKENAGGDYYWTFFPQPTFVSTQKYYCHVDNSCYMNFDFSAPEYHELALWEDKTTCALNVLTPTSPCWKN
jgi:alpha-glucosidase